MKRIPPMALLIFSRVFCAVWPMYSPTRSARSHSTRCPLKRTPIASNILPKMRATVVLPVPGFPLKIMWRASGSVARRVRAALLDLDKGLNLPDQLFDGLETDQVVELLHHLPKAVSPLFLGARLALLGAKACGVQPGSAALLPSKARNIAKASAGVTLLSSSQSRTSLAVRGGCTASAMALLHRP